MHARTQSVDQRWTMKLRGGRSIAARGTPPPLFFSSFETRRGNGTRHVSTRCQFASSCFAPRISRSFRKFLAWIFAFFLFCLAERIRCLKIHFQRSNVHAWPILSLETVNKGYLEHFSQDFSRSPSVYLRFSYTSSNISSLCLDFFLFLLPPVDFHNLIYLAV